VRKYKKKIGDRLGHLEQWISNEKWKSDLDLEFE
jgi:hypothetical protein